MLAKKYRLPSRARVGNGLFLSCSELNVKISQNGLSFNRFSVIVSKKIDKRATVRNRIRRLIYAVVGEIFQKSKKGLDILFIIKRAAVGKSKKDFYVIIESLLKKAGFLN